MKRSGRLQLSATRFFVADPTKEEPKSAQKLQKWPEELPQVVGNRPEEEFYAHFAEASSLKLANPVVMFELGMRGLGPLTPARKQVQALIRTGTVDIELGRAAPIMVKDASRVIERMANITSAIAMAIAGALLVIPLGSYYTELFKTIQRIM